MSRIARADYDAYGSVELTFAYNPGLIAAPKAEIPAASRSYDPDSRTWTIGPEHAARAVLLLRHYFPAAEIRDDDDFDIGPEPIRSADRAYAVLHLLPSAPPELIQAAFRVLAKKHHPDLGGDGAAMQEINRAFEEIRVAS